MALFKVFKGASGALNNQARVDGYCWFTYDDGKFYIDYTDPTDSQVKRQVLNSEHAEQVNHDWKLQLNHETTLKTYNGSAEQDLGKLYAPTSAGTANQLLVSSGNNVAPTWKATANGAAYATGNNSELTFGTLPIAQGGTGTATAPNISGLIYASSTSSYASTSAGTSGQILKSNGSGSTPGWYDTTVATFLEFESTPTSNSLKMVNSGGIYDFVKNQVVHYGVCSTAAGTAQKEVSIPNITELYTGLHVYVKFTNRNTATSPTLKINTLTAKSIVKYGTTTPDSGCWVEGELVEFIYDGTYFIGVDQGTASEDCYGAVKLYNNIDSTSTGLAATANAAKLAYDRAGSLMNRTVAVTANDTGYTDTKARGEKLLTTSSLNSLTSSGLAYGAIAWGYE